MQKQNLNLALLNKHLKGVKALATDLGTSMSALVKRLLEEELARYEGRDGAP